MRCDTACGPVCDGRLSKRCSSSPAAVRRISNRESARRLRKQRSEKLHNLMAQQDSLTGLNDGLQSQIVAERAKLKALHSLNHALQTRLGLQITSHVSGELIQTNSRLYGLESVTGASDLKDLEMAMDDVVMSQHGEKSPPLCQSAIKTRSAQRASCHAGFDVHNAVQHLTTSDHMTSLGSSAASMAAKAAAAAAAAAMVFPVIGDT